MQKKLIALAIAGIMAAPAAMAGDVTVYGKVRLSVDMDNNNADTSVATIDTNGDGTADAVAKDSAVSVSSNSSRIGFKGGEDLDNGMKAVWQIESQIEMDDGSDFSSKLRNTYGGVAGGFGTVILGIHDTPYKMAAKNVEVFGDSVADYNAIVQGDVRSSNVIAYLSPNFSGLSVAAAYVPSYTNDDLPQTEGQADNTATSISLTYQAGDLMVAVATETLGTSADDMTYSKIGATYALGATTLGLVYETNDASGDDQTAIYASVAHKMDKTTLKAGYGQLGESTNNAKDGASLIAVGATQKVGPNTEVFAIYASLSNDDGGTNSLKSFGGVAMGETASSLSLGINHNF